MARIVAAAVDERGNATADAARELVLRRGAYDFYYFSPAVSANTALPNPGTYTGLANGADYMALAHRETIDPSKGSKHYIPEVCFYRMGSYIDVRIRPRAGEVVGTLEVTGDGLQLWGLPASGRYEIGDYPYRLITEGRGGMVEFAASDFAAEEGTTATASTLGVGGGRAVLPGYAGELQVKVTLTSDGKEMKLDASLAGHNFAPGYRYVVELGVGRIADNPELDIEILPWNEYDWGDGGIGGGGYLPIEHGRQHAARTRTGGAGYMAAGCRLLPGQGRQLASAHGERVVLLLVRRTQRARTRPVYGGELLVVDDQCVECGSGMDVRFRLRHSV